MRKFATRAVMAFGTITLTATLFAAAPAQAEMISPKNPASIVSIVESQGLPAKLVTKDGANPYIESSRNGLKFLVLFLNCDGDNTNCTTLQYYMGFSDAKGTTLDKLNQWNMGKRFARAYRDKEGDPVLEMDVDLDFDGLPRQNVGETMKTWAALMDAYRSFLFDKAS